MKTITQLFVVKKLNDRIRLSRGYILIIFLFISCAFSIPIFTFVFQYNSVHIYVQDHIKFSTNIIIQVSVNILSLNLTNACLEEFSGEYTEVLSIAPRSTFIRKYTIEEIYFAVTTNTKRIRSTTTSFLKFWTKFPRIQCAILLEENDFMNNRNITHFLVHEGISCRILLTNTTNYEERYIELFQNLWNNQNKQMQWFAVGDDDTVWFISNLLDTLVQYNSTNLIYLGDVSDRQRQIRLHGSFFAYGGGGIILSRPLTSLFAQNTQRCKQMTGHFGGDGRIGKCLIDVMNVSLTRNMNFHQNDLEGDNTGVMESGINGLVSLHHIFSVWNPFPHFHSDRSDETMHLLELAYKKFDRYFLKRYVYVNRNINQTLLLTLGYSFNVIHRLLSHEELTQVENTGCCHDIVGRKTRPKEDNKMTWFFRRLTTETRDGMMTYYMVYENKFNTLIPTVNIKLVPAYSVCQPMYTIKRI